jgi:hypothetical protein
MVCVACTYTTVALAATGAKLGTAEGLTALGATEGDVEGLPDGATVDGAAVGLAQPSCVGDAEGGTLMSVRWFSACTLFVVTLTSCTLPATVADA